MKKIVLLIALFASYGAVCQIDTTHAWQRVPGYYYEDTNWWDYYCFSVTPQHDGWEYNQFARFPLGGMHSEFARHCYTDTALRVIGIAAAVTYSTHENTIDTVLGHRPVEYLRLYDADGMNLLGEARYDRTKESRRMAVEYWRHHIGNNVYRYEEELRDVVEVYFDQPVEVKDSFYVSGTQYGDREVVVVDTVVTGNGIELPRTRRFFEYPVSCFWKTASISGESHYLFPSRPGYYACRELSVDPSAPDGEWRYVPDGGYLNIFPIIDTNRSASPDNMRQESGQFDVKKQLGQFTYVMPNPARGKVTVASSFRISKVQVYDASGKLVLASEPDAMSVSFDVSILPKGTYSVAVSTNRGIVHKRLIVE